MADVDLFAPLSSLQWVDRAKLRPNDYNPNKVSRENLELLTCSIETNGWTLPIVVRPDYTIIDGFHRWTVAGAEPLRTQLGGKVPVVIVRHEDASEDIYGTVTHNRARGTHLLEPMKAIVKRLMNEGKSVSGIGKQLGMRPEEVFRLSDFSREDFLAMMTKGVKGYSHAELLTKISRKTTERRIHRMRAAYAPCPWCNPGTMCSAPLWTRMRVATAGKRYCDAPPH